VLERGGLLIAHHPKGPEDTLRAGSGNTFSTSHRPIRFNLSKGRALSVAIGDSAWPRRPLGEPGSVFRIKPVRPVADLRRAAIAKTPPVETGEYRPTDLVELIRLDPTIKLDIRYASARNFLGTPVYTQARAFLQRPAAEAVARIHRRLRTMGVGLLIHDGYRPWYVTKIFWDATPPAQHEFVADPATGSRHNRGCAIDLSLYDLKTGRPIDMPGVYDEFSHRSYPDYPGGTSRQRWYRDLLRREMEADGFTVNGSEWWHFDFKDWRAYGISNVPFEAIRD
jgi:D-alanyl-D-alanine dipeptidase